MKNIQSFLLVACFSVVLSATASAATITSTGTGGNWSAGGTWVGGVVPTPTDDVIIADGATVTIDVTTSCASLQVGQGSSALLQYQSGTAVTLTVTNNVTINTLGEFTSAATGTTLTHVLSVGGNLTNNGTLDFSTNGNTAAAGITFTGASSNSFSGNGPTTDIRTITINKGTSTASVLELETSNFTVRGVTSDVAGFLTLTNGMFKLSGSFTGTNRVFLSAGYTIGATTGFWLNNSNYTIAGQNGSLTLNGSLRITSGTYLIGTLMGNSLQFNSGSSFTMEGGALTITGRFQGASTTQTIVFAMSGGTLTVRTLTASSNNLAGFDLQATGSSFTMSGGTIAIQDENTSDSGNAVDYRNQASTVNVTGGTVQFGNSSTSAGRSFVVAQSTGSNNVFPSMVIDPGQTHTVTLVQPVTVRGNLTIGSGTSLIANGLAISMTGNASPGSAPGNWTNNGTFTPGIQTTTFNGTTNQTIGGSAATTFSTLTIANTGTSDDVVSLTSSALTTVSTALNVNDGVFDMGAASNLTTNAVTIAAAGTFRNLGTGDLTLSGNLSNAGAVRFSANGSPCGDADDVLIRSSVGGAQRNWTGVGTFALSDVDVQDQAGTAVIVVQSGTNSGNNGLNWTFVGCTSNTYTWNGSVSTDWQIALNWTPTRTTPAINDVLQITTGSPTITNIPTEEIAALRISGGADPVLQAGAANNTLTLSGKTGTDLSIGSGSVATISGANALRFSVTSGSNADVTGQIIFQDAAHRLIANASSSALFHSGAIFTTTTGFAGNPFGSGGGGGNGSTGSVQFESGSQYFHGAGDSPFGLSTNPAVVAFQTGSEAHWLTATGFQASGRTYATLVIGNSTTETDVSDTGSGNFQFTNLLVISTGSATSSLVFDGTGASTVVIKGNITSAGTGAIGNLPDVDLEGGTGGILIDAGGTITFGNIGNTRGIFFDSDATVASGTTLNLSRLVQMGFSADGTVTDNGIIVPNFLSISGYIIGAVRKPAVPASYTFPVGKVTGYTPVELSSASGGGDLTVRAVGFQHGSIDDHTSLDEYWTLTLNSGSLTTSLEFNYLDADVDGTESNYRVIKINGSTIVNYPATILNTTANTAEVSNISGFSHWTLGEPVGPSAVKLARFNAVKFSDGVQINWETGFEVDNLGYHVYRERDGKRVRITPSVVAGSALKVGAGNRMTAGYSYSWFDPEGTAEASYHLEAIDLDGRSDFAGPITPHVGASNSNRRAPHRGRAKLLDELSSTAAPGVSQTNWPTATKSSADYSPSSFALAINNPSEAAQVQRAIAAGEAIKIEVRKNGWYRLTQAELVSAGFDLSADARYLRLFVNGEEVPISLSTSGARFNANDTLEFFGVGLNTPTTDTQTYWLITGDTPGKRLIARRGKLKPFDESEITLRSFAVTAERREKLVYFSSLLNGESENIFGRVVRNQPVTQTLTLTHLDGAASWQPELEVALQGLTSNSHQISVQLNGTVVGTMSFGGRAHPVNKFALDRSLLVSGENVVTLTSSSAADISLIDWVRLSYPHQYKAVNDSLTFTAPGGDIVRLEGFASPNVRVVDITNPNEPTQLAAFAAHSNGNYAIRIQTIGNGLRTLIAFKEELSQQPVAIKRNQRSNLSDSNNAADMLIIAHKDFRSAMEPLADLRRHQGMAVMVVDVEDVYDEYSYGAHTPIAIKSFLADAAENWQRKPQYLLLVGDSTWDPRNYLDLGDNDFVPTKLIDTEHSETVSDDWLADFGNTGVAQMAIGRLPGRSATEISVMVSKILKYEQERELNSPLRGAVLVADTGFETRNAETGNLLPSSVAKKAINRSEVGNDDLMRGQIVSALNEGPMIVNYYGHGSVNVWTGAGLLDNDLVSGLTNTNRPSVYVMMTCLNGYASDAFVDSLAESSLKAQNGGAAAVWASSGFTEPQSQFALSSEFYRLLFGGQPVRLGEATRAAKAATLNLDVRRTWILLGDPAMRIR